MAWDLSSNIDDEIGRVLATQTVSRGQIAELYPPYPYRLRAPIVESGAVVDGRFEQGTSAGPAPAVVSAAVLDSLRGIRKAAEGMPQLVGTGPGIGSNSWVVSGDHTNTGQPILANDPHLAPSIPGIWYQMGLHCRTLTSRCPFDVGGFTFSGLPGVVIGHNQRIAWGFTNLAADVADLYLERVDDRAGTYRYGGRARALSTRTETIRVADGEDVEITVRSTGHGPLLSDVDEEMSEVAVRAGAPAIALCWTALDPRGTANALFALNRAGSWEEFRAAARQFAVPPQNMVYADVDGHIGYQAPGAIPIRRTGDGRWPAPGWNPAYDWQREYVPFDALPRMLDPDSGVVVAANQAVIGPGYPYYLGESWSYGYRSQRLSELIEADRSLSAEDMTAMQLDSRSAAVDELLPYLLDIDLGRPYIRQGQRVLRQWDRAQEADSAGAAFFNMVWRSLLERTFHDQLPEEVWPERGDRWHEVVRRLLEQPRNAWWDDTTTEEERETRDDILVASLVDARYEITRRIASDPRLWAWGDLHRLELVHPSLGRSGVSAVEWLFNRGPAEVGGGEAVVNATGWSALEDFSVIWAPSMRMVVSVGDFDESRWINQSGASGHAFNGHYDDQFPLWAEGETIAWPFSRAAVDDAAEDSLVLTPAGS
jgi:penicillin amidase